MKPRAIICVTGSELSRGETRDLNGPFLGTELTSAGVRVEEIRILPDDPERLEAVFRDCVEAADIVLASGGLGPTADDHTVQVVARVFGRGVKRDPEAEARMRERVLARVGSEDRIPANFFKQAEVVEGAQVLLNPVGLAPGCLVETRRGILVVLPGVPRELRALYRECVLPEILTRFHLAPPRIFRARILGLGESWAESRVQNLGIDFGRLEYGISARPGELLVKFIAHEKENHPYIDEVRRLLEAEFGEDLLPLEEGLLDATGKSRDIDHSGIVHRRLIESGRTLATAESCTGGLIAKMLTDHAGSSSYLLGSVVAYHDRIKETLLGVPAELLREHGAVSAEVCRAMALAARRRFAADYGIGVTGIAGPGGGTAEKPVGLVFIGLARPEPRADEGVAVLVERHQLPGDRAVIRQLTATRALDLVRRELGRSARRQ